MSNNKIYKVGEIYYKLDSIQSISELNIGDNCGYGKINGIKVEWHIGYKHYKPEHQDEVINKHPLVKEYRTLLKAFKEQNND